MNDYEGWTLWGLLSEGDNYEVRFVPGHLVVLKEQQYVMNYALINKRTSRVEVLFPTEVAANHILAEMEKSLLEQQNVDIMSSIMKGITGDGRIN